MIDFDASPQLKAVKTWFNAYSSLDVNKLEPLVSKNYQYEALPESLGLPKETKGGHVQRIGENFPMLNKIEVRIQHWRTALELAS